MSWYCDVAPGHPHHGPYHDHEYGFPATDERVLLERLSLEIFQAGLSWLIVLRKRPAIRAAFEGFDPDRVAAYGAKDRARLLGDAGIIRNRRKIDAIIENARRLRELGAAHGGFAGWIESHHPMPKDEWVQLFRDSLVFTGGEVVGEFLISIGYLPGAHRRDCPVYRRIAALDPPWMQAPSVYGADAPS